MTRRGWVAALILGLAVRIHVIAPPFVAWFSNLTYSWYLTHGLALLAMFRAFPKVHPALAHPLGMIAALAASSAMYYGVERTARRLATTLLQGAMQPSAASPR